MQSRVYIRSEDLPMVQAVESLIEEFQLITGIEGFYITNVYDPDGFTHATTPTQSVDVGFKSKAWMMYEFYNWYAKRSQKPFALAICNDSGNRHLHFTIASEGMLIETPSGSLVPYKESYDDSLKEIYEVKWYNTERDKVLERLSKSESILPNLAKFSLLLFVILWGFKDGD